MEHPKRGSSEESGAVSRGGLVVEGGGLPAGGWSDWQLRVGLRLPVSNWIFASPIASRGRVDRGELDVHDG